MRKEKVEAVTDFFSWSFSWASMRLIRLNALCTSDLADLATAVEEDVKYVITWRVRVSHNHDEFAGCNRRISLFSSDGTVASILKFSANKIKQISD